MFPRFNKRKKNSGTTEETAPGQKGFSEWSNPEKVQEHLLITLCDTLKEGICKETTLRENQIYLPKWEISITPTLNQISQQGAVLDFYLSAPQWGKKLYECCASMGKTPEQALGSALGLFVFCFLQGILDMEEQVKPIALESSFAGHTHRWNAYLSNIVGQGESPALDGTCTIYWNALKEEIIKRLGNQKLCYVKIYGSKVNGEVIGECRIDDIKSEELSAKVAELVEKWDVKQFASHKQFFFLRQDEATTLPTPYIGHTGRALLKSKVTEAVRLFHAADTREKYDALPEKLEQALGDTTLAQECYFFLPELCTEIAFGEQVLFPECLELFPQGREKLTLYKTQLAEFYLLWDILNEIFRDGTFGAATDAIYSAYISVSASYGGIRKVQESGSSLEGCKQTEILYSVSQDFEIR